MQVTTEEHGDIVKIIVAEERMDAHNSGALKEEMLQFFDE